MFNNFKKFFRNEEGNFAIIGALLLLPVLGVTGAVVDYSRIANAQNRLQVAVDAAAITTARSGEDVKDMQQLAADMVVANYGDGVDAVETTVNTHELIVEAQDIISMSVLATIGKPYVTIHAAAKVASRLPLGGGKVSGSDMSKLKRQMRAQKRKLEKYSKHLTYDQRLKLEQAIKKQMKLIQQNGYGLKPSDVVLVE